MKIEHLRLSHLRNEEHFQFHPSFRDLLQVHQPVLQKVSGLFTTFLSCYDNELIALDAVRKNNISDDMSDADIIRDKIFRGFKHAVKSGFQHYNNDMSDAGHRIMSQLNVYGDIPSKNYDAETAAIISLVADMKGTYKKDMELLNLDGWVDELERTNKAFDDLKNNRYSDFASKTLLKMKEERKKTDDVYLLITEMINALMLVEGEANYVTFANELNERIRNFELLRSKKSSQKGSKTAEK